MKHRPAGALETALASLDHPSLQAEGVNIAVLLADIGYPIRHRGRGKEGVVPDPVLHRMAPVLASSAGDFERNRDVATVRYSACTNEKPLDAWSTSGLTTYAQLQTSQCKLPATVAHSVEAGDTGTREGSSQTGGACVKTAAERKWKI